MVRLFLFCLVFLLTACSVSPIDIVQSRYDNIGEDRELEVALITDNVAIILGKKIGGKCKEVEVVALNNLNAQKEWKIIKLQNERDCNINATNVLKDKFFRWKYDK